MALAFAPATVSEKSHEFLAVENGLMSLSSCYLPVHAHRSRSGPDVPIGGSVALSRSAKIFSPEITKPTATTTCKPQKTLPVGVARVLKRLQYPLEVILLRVRWYVAYSLSLGDLEDDDRTGSRGRPFERASLGDQAGTVA
jgi:hypothetical protein